MVLTVRWSRIGRGSRGSQTSAHGRERTRATHFILPHLIYRPYE